jgi:hypothetical protein
VDTPGGLLARLVAGEWEIAMNFVASGRLALIILAGLWLCLAGPTGAQESDQDATANTASDASTNTESADAPVAPNRPVKRPAKKPVAAQSRQPAKLASKPSNAKKADDAQGSQDDPSSPSISPSVSNAKAQFGAGGSLADNAPKSMSAPAENLQKTARQSDPTDASAANTETVSADQLNAVDRTLSQDRALAPPVVMAMVPTPSAASNVDSTWGRTSLIGKVFVALGGLLTLASAARMFIA